MSTVDKRVVQMEFDNASFEKNVKTSMSTLDKLKQALKLDDTSKGLDEISNAAKKVDMGSLGSAVESVQAKFSALDVIAVTALSNITNKAISAGESLVKSLSINNISAGWEKFGQKTTSVATLVAQGYDLDTVNDQLERLNWFTDETSYNFTDMVSNIAKFTATGQDLETSVTAMEGIAEWASLSGQNATAASHAMYQLSQAMGAGVMRLEDYKSIQNVSMDTEEFRQKCLDAGVALGTLKKNADDTYTSLVNDNGDFSLSQFASHLTDDAWLTSDVMMEVFNQYSNAVDDIYNYAQEKGITASEAIAELGDSVDSFGLKAFQSAQEAKTWADVLDSVKDAVSTGWMNTFETIFGDYEDQRVLWTQLANDLYDIFAAGGETRNSILEQAFGESSDWTDYLEKVNDAGIATDDFTAALEEAAKSGKPLSQVLLDFANSTDTVGTTTEDLNAKLEETQKIFDDVWNGAYGNGADRVKAFAEAGLDYDKIQSLVNEHTLGYKLTLEDLGEEQLAAVGYTDEQIAAIKELAAEAEAGGMSIEELMNAMNRKSGRELFADSLHNIAQAVLGFKTVLEEATSAVFGFDVAGVIYKAISAFDEFTKALVVIDEETGKLTTTGLRLKNLFKGLFSVVAMVGDVFGAIGEGVLQGIGENFDGVGNKVLICASAFGTSLTNMRKWVQESGVLAKITETVAKVVNVLAKAIAALIKAGLKVIGTLLQNASKYASKFAEALSKGIQSVKDWVEQSGILTTIFETMSVVLGVVVSAVGKFVSIVTSGLKSLANWVKQNNLLSTALTTIWNVLVKSVTAIKNWFTAFANLPIVQNGIKALKELFVKLFNALVEGFKQIKPTLQELGEKLGPAFQELMEKLGELKGFDIKKIGEIFAEFGEKVKTAFSESVPFIKIFTDAMETVRTNASNAISFVTEKFEKFQAISEKVTSFLANNMGVTFGKVFSGVLGISTIKGLYDLSKVFSSINSVTSDLKGGLTGIMTQIANTFKAFQSSIKADVLLKMAVAIGVLAASLVALTLVDQTKLKNVAIILGSLISVVGGIAIALQALQNSGIKSLSGFGGNFSTGGVFAGLGVALLAIAASLAILVKALVELDAIDIDMSMIAKLGVLALVAAACVGLFYAMKAVNAAVPGSSLTSSVAMIAYAASIKLLVESLAELSNYPLETILSSCGKVVLIMGAMAAAGLASSAVGETSATSILASVIALKLLISAFKDIAELDLGDIVGSIGKLILIMGSFVLLMKASGKAGQYAQHGGVAVLLCAAAMLIVVDAMKEIAAIPESDLGRAMAVIAEIELLFAAIIAVSHFAGQYAKDAGIGILAMSAAVGILVGCIYLLTKMSPSEVDQAMLTIAQIEILFGALIAVSALAKSVDFKPIIALAMSVAALAVIAIALSQIPAEQLGPAVAALDSLIVCFGILVACSSLIAAADWKGMAIDLALMVVAVGILAGIVAIIANIDSTNVLPNATAISEMLVAIGVCMALVGALPVSAAITMIAGILAFVGGVFAIASAIGGFIQNSGMKQIVLDGLDFLITMAGKLGEAIGEFIGGIALGLVNQFTKIVQTLEAAMSDAQLLFVKLSVLSALKDGALTGATALADVIAKISTESMWTGIKKFFGRGYDMTQMGTDLANFGSAVTAFYDSTKDIKNTTGFKNVAEASSYLADTLNAMSRTSFSVLEEHTEDWSKSLGDFGKSLVTFCEDVQPLGDDGKLAGLDPAITTTEKMITLMGEINDASTIFDDIGSLLGKGNSLSQFGDSMADFGKGLVNFAKSIQVFGGAGESVHEIGGLQTINGGLSLTGDALGKAIDTSIDIATRLIELYKTINESKDAITSILDTWSESNSMANFGKNLVPFAEGLVQYAQAVQVFGTGTTNLGTFDSKSFGSVSMTSGVDESIKVAEKILGFAQKLKTTWSSGWSLFTGEQSQLSRFGTNVKQLGVDLASYCTNVADITDVSTSIDVLSGLVGVVGDLQDLDVNVLGDLFGVLQSGSIVNWETLSEGLASIGTDIVTTITQGMTDAVAGISEQIGVVVTNIITVFTNQLTLQQESITTTIGTVINTCITYIDGKQEQFTVPVTNIITAVKNKISENETSVKTTVANVVSSCASAINDAYGDFVSAGAYLMDGLAEGIASHADAAISAAEAVAAKVKAATKAALDEASPSKATYEMGKFWDQGLANGMTAFTGVVTNAAASIGDGAMANLKSRLSTLYDMVDSNIDYQPTITPLLDTSELEAGASSIGSILNGGTISATRSLDLARAASAMSATAKSNAEELKNNQNGTVTNNYTFTQNNTSPKALSRLDIYRQTKNQFSQLKEATSTK